MKRCDALKPGKRPRNFCGWRRRKESRWKSRLGLVRQVRPEFRVLESEELAHLEKNIYKYPYEKFNKSSGDVCICASANPYTEVEECARDIIKLCRDKGYRYRNIAVTMRNPDSYESIIKSVFTRYGIPFFLDGKRDIDGHPLIVFILSALDIFINNWNYESVFRYARTGFSGVDREDLDLLENYVLANGIRKCMDAGGRLGLPGGSWI